MMVGREMCIRDRFGGVPTGDANAQDAATAIAINTAFGSAPSCLAIAIPIGHSKAAEAVLDMVKEALHQGDISDAAG